MDTMNNFDLASNDNATINRHTFYDTVTVGATDKEAIFFVGSAGQNQDITNLPNSGKLPTGQSFDGFALGLKLDLPDTLTIAQLRQVFRFLYNSNITYKQNNAELGIISGSEFLPPIIAAVESEDPTLAVTSSLNVNSIQEIQLGQQTPHKWVSSATFRYPFRTSQAPGVEVKMRFEVKGLLTILGAPTTR